MPKPKVADLPPHLVYIEPIQDRPAGDSTVETPAEARRAYVNLGWVIAVPKELEENLSEGDLVVFQPWAGKNLPTKQYHSYRTHYYVVHEDDCILVLEDW